MRSIRAWARLLELGDTVIENVTVNGAVAQVDGCVSRRGSCTSPCSAESGRGQACPGPPRHPAYRSAPGGSLSIPRNVGSGSVNPLRPAVLWAPRCWTRVRGWRAGVQFACDAVDQRDEVAVCAVPASKAFRCLDQAVEGFEQRVADLAVMPAGHPVPAILEQVAEPGQRLKLAATRIDDRAPEKLLRHIRIGDPVEAA